MAKKEATTGKLSVTAKDLATKVAEEIAGMGPSVEEALINARVERELNKRVSALDIVWEKLSRFEKELARCRPDLVTYDDLGAVVASNWSKGAVDAKKKIVEQIAKLEGIIGKALEKGDFSEVYKISDNAKGGSEKPEHNKKTDDSESSSE